VGEWESGGEREREREVELPNNILNVGLKIKVFNKALKYLPLV